MTDSTHVGGQKSKQVNLHAHVASDVGGDQHMALRLHLQNPLQIQGGAATVANNRLMDLQEISVSWASTCTIVESTHSRIRNGTAQIKYFLGILSRHKFCKISYCCDSSILISWLFQS